MVGEKLSFAPALLLTQKRQAPNSANFRSLATSSEIEQMRDRGHLPLINVQIPPLVARVLVDEGYFGDGPPTWPGAPTSKDAKNTRKRYIKRLRHFAPEFPDAEELANTLDGCKPGRRCMSAACPECGGAIQRWFVAEVVNLTSNDSPLELIAVSIAFPPTARWKTSSTRSTRPK
jgi:hypothetical protein